MKCGLLDIIKGFNSTIAFAWLLSYMLVLAIPLAISAFVYSEAIKLTEQEALSSMNKIVDGEKQYTDNILTELDAVYSDVWSNSRVQQLARIQSDDGHENIQQMQLYDIKNDLYRLIATGLRSFSDIYSDIYIVFNKANVAISTVRADDLANFFEAEGPGLGDDFHKWQNDMQNYYEGVLQRSGDGLIYLRTITYSGKGDNAATLAVKISGDKLRSRFSSNPIYDSGISIMADNDGKLLFASQSIEHDFVTQIISASKDIQSSLIDLKGKHYYISRSQLHNTIYIFLIRQDSILGKLNYLKLIIIAGIALSVIAGIFISLFFTNRNIKPIRSIMSLVWQRKEVKNEFIAIERGIALTIDEKNKLAKAVGSLKPIVQTSLVERLLRGKGLDEQIAAQAGIEFRFRYFCSAIISIEDMGVFEPEDSESISKDEALLYAAVTNVLRELLSGRCDVYFASIEEEIVMLVNTDSHDNGLWLENALFNCYQTLSERLGIQGYIALSRLADNIKDLPQVCDEAYDTLDHMRISGSYGLRRSDILSSDGMVLNGSGNDAERFISSVISANEEEAVATVNSVFEKAKNSGMRLGLLKYIMIDMARNAAKALGYEASATAEEKAKYTDLITNIVDSKGISGIKQEMNKLIKLICGFAQSNNNRSGVEEEVARYIKANYENQNINFKIISDAFSITPTYLSQKFKTKYGVSILDFINQLRLEKAKELLKNTNKPLADICEGCGFTNTVTFTRLFKKHFGVTPGKYRQYIGIF